MRPCCLVGEVVVQRDYRRTCRTSDARLALLPAPWEGHFGDSAEAAGGHGKACKPFNGLESLVETGSARPDGLDVNGFACSVLHDPGRLEELQDPYVAPREAQGGTRILVRWACEHVREARGFWT